VGPRLAVVLVEQEGLGAVVLVAAPGTTPLAGKSI
jgi:hypothetical protein